jgi:hypothetical protein
MVQAGNPHHMLVGAVHTSQELMAEQKNVSCHSFDGIQLEVELFL